MSSESESVGGSASFSAIDWGIVTEAVYQARDWPSEVERYRTDGFCLGVFPNGNLEAIRDQIDALLTEPGRSADPSIDVRGEIVFQIYDIPRRPEPLGTICQEPRLKEMAQDLLGDEAVTAWALLLNKANTNTANWAVPWHQDTSVYCEAAPAGAICEQRGGFATFRPRDNSAGRLVVARIALDPDTQESGSLFVLPGSHQYGNLWPDGGARFAGHVGTPIELALGEVLFFNPLLMHRADRCRTTAHQRRVVHVYYRPASMKLPDGAHWIDWDALRA